MITQEHFENELGAPDWCAIFDIPEKPSPELLDPHVRLDALKNFDVISQAGQEKIEEHLKKCSICRETLSRIEEAKKMAGAKEQELSL